MGPGHISIAHLTALGRGRESCNCRQRPSLHLGFSCVEEKKRKGRKVSESEGKQVRVRAAESGLAVRRVSFSGNFPRNTSRRGMPQATRQALAGRYLVLSADNRMTSPTVLSYIKLRLLVWHCLNCFIGCSELRRSL